MSDLSTVSLKAVFDATPVGLGVVDANQRLVLMNRAFRESLSLPVDVFPTGIPVNTVDASVLRGGNRQGGSTASFEAVPAADSRPTVLRRWTLAGRHFGLFNTPMPDGGSVVTTVETLTPGAESFVADQTLAQTATAVTMLRIGLAIFDAEKKLLLANPRFAALLVLPPDRILPGSSFDALVSLMQTRAEFAGPDGLAFINALRNASSEVSCSVFHKRTDGRSIGVMLDPLPDGGRSVSISDITPQARAEDDARRRARLLDLVLLNIPHGICVYGPDRRVAMFNDTYTKVMEGAPLQVGDTLADVIRRRAEAGEYGAGTPDSVFVAQMGFDIGHAQMRRRVRPNGTAIDVRTAPLPDGGHISVVTDISALVQAEAELRRRADEMSTMLGHIQHGIMLWGPDRHLVASNPVAADLLDLPADVLTPGRTEAEVIGLLPTGEDANKTYRLLDLDQATPHAKEITTPSGRILQAQSNHAPGGGWISTFTDITRMRETESELRRSKELAEAANEAKSRFLATMSHELRTPLNAIIGYSDTMARETGRVPAELVTEYSSQINTAGKQLLSLINIILDVARIESGRFEPNAEIVDIGKAIQTAVRQVDSAAQAGEVSVELKLADDLPLLRGDIRRLTQAVTQLVSNAVKFTDAGGFVTVEAGLMPLADLSEGDLIISVTDTGIGIPAGELARVYEPFTQLDGSLSRRYPGAGLGLFMARAVVTAHGGQLLLSSEPGVGTVARIILPRSRIVS